VDYNNLTNVEENADLPSVPSLWEI
jgi:hypothetical protein